MRHADVRDYRSRERTAPGLREVSDPQLSPDGAWVAYTVTTADTVRDRRDKDVWMTTWNGARSVRVTSSPDQEHDPRWSPDGRYLAFLSSRQGERDADQLWLLDRAGGGAGQGNALGGYGTDMYVLEYEAELGKPWKNPEAWTRVSYPFLHADRIVTSTLFLCGDEDWNVPLSNSEQMYQALKSLGRETQLIVYPGESHDITRPSFVEDRMDRYLAWYGKYLGATAGPSAPATAGGGTNGQR